MRSLILPILLLIAIRIQALSIDLHEINPCSQSAAELSVILAKYLQAENSDSAAMLLLRWELACPGSEPVFRAKVLEKARKGSLTEIASMDGLLDFAVAFEVRHNLLKQQDAAISDEYFELYPEYFGYVPLGGDFDRQTRRLAASLLTTTPANSIAYDLLQLYSGEPEKFFGSLKAGNHAGTPLQNEYNQKVEYFMAKPEISFGLISGLWIPQDDLAIIGTKPKIGLYTGVTKGALGIKGLVYIRAGKTSKDFQINVKDSLVITRNHQGVYLGLEGNIRLLRIRSRATAGIMGGVGYDIIDIVEDTRTPQRETFRSPAFSGGVYYEQIFANRSRLIIAPVYVWLNHNHPIGSPVGGNALLVSIKFGFSENVRKTQNLKRLGY